MPILVSNRKFVRLDTAAETNFLLVAKDDIISAKFEVQVDYSFTSSTVQPILILSANQLQLISGNWSNLGFEIGDTINIAAVVDSGANINVNATITNIDGNVLTHNGSVSNVGSLAPDGDVQEMTVSHQSIQDPKQIDVLFNLIENSQSFTVNSLIDGEQNVIRYDVDGIAVTDVRNGLIVGNKSGAGLYKAFITRLSDVNSKKRYEIEIQFFNWLSFQEQDLTIPTWYQGTNTIKPVYQIKAYRTPNNPNSFLTQNFFNQLGNVGWYNENYNQGANPFTIYSFELFDINNNPISAVNFAGDTKVKIKVLGSGDFRDEFIVTFYTIPFSNYKNKPESWRENVFLSFYSNWYSFCFGINGGEIEIKDVTYDNSTTGEVEVEFTLSPNSAFAAYFANIDPRWYRLSLTLETDAGTPTSNDRTTLLLQQAQMAIPPVIGEQTETINGINFYDHWMEVTDPPIRELKSMTEDDILAKVEIELQKSVNYESIAVKIQVQNNLNNERFDLFSRTIPLGQYPITPSGVRLVNYNEQLGFNLPSPERNYLELKYNNVDLGTSYILDFTHTFQNNWRYWLSQPNALTDFLDMSIPNNGQNQEWVRYAINDVSIIYRIEVVEDDVTNFFDTPFGIADYDTGEATTVITLTDLNDNPLGGIPNNQTIKVKALHTFPSPIDVNLTKGWIRVRPREGEPPCIISTKWDWTSANLPLKPLSGETKCKKTQVSSTEILLECELDGTLLNGQLFTIVSRIDEIIT